ncbi:hypothetical protein I316_05250 [Kwoniella heveanensis BCC8398]|uniref:Uncharacterized protein n=1 Tax=Kwoniella heveanensis BCC8398 TaxID=1296120 RepID=A0A1B9GQS3_9TREE|nr:hypothetical protein I316_05250 [Kwoniella heveanensis BCC8398]
MTHNIPSSKQTSRSSSSATRYRSPIGTEGGLGVTLNLYAIPKDASEIHGQAGTVMSTADDSASGCAHIQIGDQARQKLRSAVQPLLQKGVDSFEAPTGELMGSEVVFDAPPRRGPLETTLWGIHAPIGPPSWNHSHPSTTATAGSGQCDHILRGRCTSSHGSVIDAGGSIEGSENNVLRDSLSQYTSSDDASRSVWETLSATTKALYSQTLRSTTSQTYLPLDRLLTLQQGRPSPTTRQNLPMHLVMAPAVF